MTARSRLTILEIARYIFRHQTIVDAQTERILGAMIFGVGGDEAIHSILDIMYADRPYTTITNAVHIHPTVAELIPTLLGSLQPASDRQV